MLQQERDTILRELKNWFNLYFAETEIPEGWENALIGFNLQEL